MIYKKFLIISIILSLSDGETTIPKNIKIAFDDHAKNYGKTEQFSNRLCPEYYSDGDLNCTTCRHYSCVIEGDILCPSNDLLDCSLFDNCRTRHIIDDETGPIKVQFWKNIMNNKVRIPVIVSEAFSEIGFYFLANQMNIMETLACVTFYVIRDGPHPTNMSISYLQQKLIFSPFVFIQKSKCMCAVSGIGEPQYTKTGKLPMPFLTIFIPDVNDWEKDENLFNESKYEPYKIKMPFVPLADKNFMSPFYGCHFNQSTYFHLFMHVLGFGHEHNRPDRANFIYIDYNNLAVTNSEVPVMKFYDRDNFENRLEKFNLPFFREKSAMIDNPFQWSYSDIAPVIIPLRNAYKPYLWGARLDYSDDIMVLQATFGKPNLKTCINAPRTMNSVWMDDYKNYTSGGDGCGDPGHSPGTKRSGDKFHYGAIVSYECINKDLTILGSPTRICTREGIWTGYPPYCFSLKRRKLLADCEVKQLGVCYLEGRTIHFDELSEQVVKQLYGVYKREIRADLPKDVIIDMAEYTKPFILNDTMDENMICVDVYYKLGSSDSFEVYLIYGEKLNFTETRKLVYKEISSESIYDINHSKFNLIVKLKEHFYFEFYGRHMGNDNPQILVVTAFWIYTGECQGSK